jgi:hypothetical protein
MKYLFTIIALLSLQSCFIGAGKNSKVEANQNNFFPKITGIDLEGNNQELPKAFVGELNIVAVAFKREQQIDVDSWITGTKKILDENNAIRFWEIPLIYELGGLSRAWVNNGMRFGIKDAQARKRTITVYTNREEFFKITKMKEEEIYVLLLNNEGKILWQTSGRADEKKLQLLNKALSSFKNNSKK